MEAITQDCSLYCCGRCRALFMDLPGFRHHKSVCTGVAPLDSLVAVTATAEHVAVPATAEHVAVPATAEHVAVPTTAEHVAFPATAEHVAVPATAEHVAVPTTAESAHVNVASRKRGRPRKCELSSSPKDTDESREDERSLFQNSAPKRPRGRPKKILDNRSGVSDISGCSRVSEWTSNNSDTSRVNELASDNSASSCSHMIEVTSDSNGAVCAPGNCAVSAPGYDAVSLLGNGAVSASTGADVEEVCSDFVDLSELGVAETVETIEITVADGDPELGDIDSSIFLNVPGGESTFQVEIPPVDHSTRVKQHHSRYTPKHSTPKPSDYTVTIEGGAECLHCNYCSYQTRFLHMLGRHLSGHNEDGRPFSCDKCKYTTVFRSTFQAHLKKHERSIQCDHCTYRCSNQRDLSRHNLRHTGVFPYRCFVCPRAFRQRDSLLIHARTHTGELFRCSIDGCGFETAYERNLKGHQRRCHGIAAQKFVCEVADCGYVSTNRSTFHNHLKSHYGLKDHRCPYCDYSSVGAGDVRRHMKLHLSQKLYQCDQCPFETSHPSALRSHVMKHKGLKPYGCGAEGCDYRASAKSRVQQHIEAMHPNQTPRIVFDGTKLKIDLDSFRNKNVREPEASVVKIKFGTEEKEAITVDEKRGVGCVSTIKQIVVESTEIGGGRVDCLQCHLCKYQCRSAAALASHQITCHEDNVCVTNQSEGLVVEGGVIDALVTVQAHMDIETS